MTTGLTNGEVRQIKQATQDLLKEFDSLKHAAGLCRATETRLGQYQDSATDDFMPIDIVLVLERAAGKPIVTTVVSSMNNAVWPMPKGDARSEAMDLPAALGELMAFIKKASDSSSQDGIRFSEHEKKIYQELRAGLDKELREVDLAVANNSNLPIQVV